MNSLTYLSRQFDVLASPRTPPSTPVTESVPLLPETDNGEIGSLKRVQTWSTKLSSGDDLSSWPLRRSHSSPSDIHPGDPSLPDSIPPPVPSQPSTSQMSKPSSRRPSVSVSEKPIRPKSSTETLLRRIFFIRVLLSLWHRVYNLWISMTRQNGLVRAPEVVVEEGTDEEEKYSDEEYKDEKPLGLEMHPAPPHPPPIQSSSPPTPLEYLNPVTRSDSSPAIPQFDPPVIIESGSTITVTTASRVNDSPNRRTPTPTLPTHKTPLHRQKTLVLDLDETLIHSTSRPVDLHHGGGVLSTFGFGRRNKGAGYTVEVVLGGRSTIYHVYKRPFVDYFLRKVSAWYTLVIFTASMQEYADPVIDWLDAGRGILTRRFFRESCTQLPNGSYTKDLSIVEQDMSRVCLVDNSPVCYIQNEANGIPIEGWTHDPHDEALLDLLPVLDSLRFTGDVRRVLGIRGFS
ncbi:hypothetical protein QCA50_000675 [Cerrena zonata]|uniref:FCP1 homology domain-containing protein n=1 Tax=Cerrena zonata TaxID=2478898 RepID=A0AAW0GX79_9APHY